MTFQRKIALLFGLCAIFMLFPSQKTWSQHINMVNATLDGDTHEIAIQQEFTYVNTSNKTLEVLYFNDWANSYSDKNTALAKTFARQFKKSLHLAKEDERGYTDIQSMGIQELFDLRYEMLELKNKLGGLLKN